VVDAEGLADHPPLSEGIKQHVPEAFMDGIKPVVRPALHDQAESFIAAPGEEKHRQDKDDDKSYNISCQNSLFLLYLAATAFFALSSLT
jgi:hypothetical protein